MAGTRKKVLDLGVLPPLDPRHYDEDREMIGHEVVPMD